MTWVESPTAAAKIAGSPSTSGKLAVGLNYAMSMTNNTVSIIFQNIGVVCREQITTNKNNWCSTTAAKNYYYKSSVRVGIGDEAWDIGVEKPCTGGWNLDKANSKGYYTNGATILKIEVGETRTFERTHVEQMVNIRVNALIGDPNYIRSEDGIVEGDAGVTRCFASGTIPIPPKTSHTVKYDPNGGSGAPDSQTKWYGEPLVLSGVEPQNPPLTFMGWATSATGDVVYQPGDTLYEDYYSTLYAVWGDVKIIRYNANGGTGEPKSQTKYSNVDLVLSSQEPTREGYTFLGWATSSSATSPDYKAGGKYTIDVSQTLYAVWELKYSVIFNNVSAVRCNSSGEQDDEGKYMLVSGRYTVAGAYAFTATTSIKVVNPSIIASTIKGGTYYKYAAVSSTTQSFSWISYNDDPTEFDGDTVYEADIDISLTSDSGSQLMTASKRVTLTRAIYILDFHSSGDGMGIGTGAPETGLDIGWPTKFYDTTTFKGGVAIDEVDAWQKALGLDNIFPVSIANGGTGASTVASARNNLGLGYTTGALPIENGGTGATTIENARGALGLGYTRYALPIANGGTSATTAADARAALGITAGNLGLVGWTITGVTYIELKAGTLAVGGSASVSATTTRIFPSNTNYAYVMMAQSYRGFVSNLKSTLNGSKTVTISGTIYNLTNASGNTYVGWYVFGLGPA